VGDRTDTRVQVTPQRQCKGAWVDCTGLSSQPADRVSLTWGVLRRAGGGPCRAGSDWRCKLVLVATEDGAETAQDLTDASAAIRYYHPQTYAALAGPTVSITDAAGELTLALADDATLAHCLGAGFVVAITYTGGEVVEEISGWIDLLNAAPSA